MTRTIIDVATKIKYQIDPRKSGEAGMPCPACSQDHPKNVNRKCMSWNDQKLAGYCHRCDASFVEFKPLEKRMSYEKPKFNDQTKLSDVHLKYFQGRMISNDALNKGRVYSSREFMPQFEKEVAVACFPYYRDGDLVNIKYRGPEKSFKLHKGSEKIFYNLDLAKDSPAVVIVEGEIDALSYLTCGINFVVSVPNGANKNLDYMDSCLEYFESKEVVYLATDNDEKGLMLREELARRIGHEKCKIVDFGICKDANEFLVKNGSPELFKTLETARYYPVSGVFTAEDFKDEIYNLWKNGLQPGLGIGISQIDNFITWEVGRLAIVTGIPGHGKSEYLDFTLTKLNLLHGWKVGYFSPENHPLQLHYAKVAEKIQGRQFDAKTMTIEEYYKLMDYIQSNYYFIAPEEEFTVDSILTKGKYLVKRYGIKVLIIDPYNRLEHQLDGRSETQYISSFLDKLTNFATRNKVLVVLVAHPFKMQKDTNGFMSIPNLYSISGSSNFYNKADYGLTVYRLSNSDGLTNEIEVYVQKVKFKHLGHTGKIELIYNYKNGRFETKTNAGINSWDNSSWLETSHQEQSDVPF